MAITRVTSGGITDGTITNADVNDVAASKLTGALPAISAASLTSIPAGNLTGALPAISGASLTNLDASDLATGTVPTARLGSGTADSTVHLRGDGAWEAAGGGKLLQVVRANYNTQVGISTYNTDVYLGLNATITPSATDSKILIFYNIQGGEAGGLYHTQLRRNDVTIFTDVSRTIQGSTLFKVPYSYYDSPASTSAQTYKIYGQQMNQGSGNSATFQWNGSASEIILMEIGA